ncbi:MAG TPA: AAA family ATPase [Chloroflexota bacterium]|nr:AAA family ATPase [Chloroflexota bacterium]
MSLVTGPAALPHALLELTALPQWVAWRIEERGGKATKVPISPLTGQRASSTDPRTWGTWEQAHTCAQSRGIAGIGFVLSADDPYVGVDLDHAIDVETGEIAPWALEIVQALDTYTEVSPSGTGLHAWCKGQLPAGGRKRGPIEMYSTGRYLTVTGRALSSARDSIEERTDALALTHAHAFPTILKEDTPSLSPGRVVTVTVDDARLIELAQNARGDAGPRFGRLWKGDWKSDYSSQSEADLSLCNALSFWAGRDSTRVDSLFRQSGLFRKKWDTPHFQGGETYGQRTVHKAVAGTRDVYEGPSLTVDISLPAAGKRLLSGVESGRKREGALVFSATSLMAETFADPRYAVSGLLPEGLCILAGKPKMGKSWLGLCLALAVAGGTPALGVVEVDAGDVLYMALEDGRRRLQRRLNDLLNDDPAPERLSLAVEWPRFPEGITAIEEWLIAHPEARLIVVDTFKRVRPEEKRGASMYGQDYEAIAPLTDLAHTYSVSIVVVMHTRKMDAEDPIDLISGSLGLSGAADGALVMQRVRGQQDALLHVIDRDAEDSEKALRWNIATGGWLLLGDAAEYKRSAARNELLAALHDLNGSTPKDLADHLNKPRGTIRRLLWEMTQTRLVTNAGGTYMALAPRPTEVPPYIENTPNDTNTANTPNRANRWP